jgi:hypothetical protein
MIWKNPWKNIKFTDLIISRPAKIFPYFIVWKNATACKNRKGSLPIATYLIRAFRLWININMNMSISNLAICEELTEPISNPTYLFEWSGTQNRRIWRVPLWRCNNTLQTITHGYEKKSCHTANTAATVEEIIPTQPIVYTLHCTVMLSEGYSLLENFEAFARLLFVCTSYVMRNKSFRKRIAFSLVSLTTIDLPRQRRFGVSMH